MSTKELYQEWKQKIPLELRKRQKNDAEYGADKNAGFMCGESAATMKDFREELSPLERPHVESLYGTNNTLFQKDFDEQAKKLKSGKIQKKVYQSAMSCQYSSAVWCRTVLKEGTSDNVHETKKETIRKLYIKYPPGNWLMNYLENAPSSPAQRYKSSLAGTCHDNITAQLKKLINPTGVSGIWPRLTVTNIAQTKAENIIASALYSSNSATLIQMKFHCFAIYTVGNNEVYVFDNTIGCLKFKRPELVKKFIKWACTRNEEMRTVNQTVKHGMRQSAYPSWTAVKVRS